MSLICYLQATISFPGPLAFNIIYGVCLFLSPKTKFLGVPLCIIPSLAN